MRADIYAVKTDTPDCHQMFFSASHILCDGAHMHQKCGDYSQIQVSVMVAEIRTFPVCVQGLRYLLFNTSLCWKKKDDWEMHKRSEWSGISQMTFSFCGLSGPDIWCGNGLQASLSWRKIHYVQTLLPLLPTMQMSRDAPTGPCSWGSGLFISQVTDAQKIKFICVYLQLSFLIKEYGVLTSVQAWYVHPYTHY